MADESKLKSLLGFAQKSGRLYIGRTPVLNALKSNATGLILFAADATKDAKARYEKRTPPFRIGTLPFTKNELGKILGREQIGVLCICDPQMANALVKLLGSYSS